LKTVGKARPSGGPCDGLDNLIRGLVTVKIIMGQILPLKRELNIEKNTK
jgi:hypothetical protein